MSQNISKDKRLSSCLSSIQRLVNELTSLLMEKGKPEYPPNVNDPRSDSYYLAQDVFKRFIRDPSLSTGHIKSLLSSNGRHPPFSTSIRNLSVANCNDKAAKTLDPISANTAYILPVITKFFALAWENRVDDDSWANTRDQISSALEEAMQSGNDKSLSESFTTLKSCSFELVKDEKSVLASCSDYKGVIIRASLLVASLVNVSLREENGLKLISDILSGARVKAYFVERRVVEALGKWCVMSTCTKSKV